MTTTHTLLTPASNQTPVVVNTLPELSGPQWVTRFPGSNRISDLNSSFRQAIESFISALTTAGANVRISATYRPRERAYLMHYCVKVAKGLISPDRVPTMNGVEIEWDHGDDRSSKNAAAQMARSYTIVHPPALISRHTERAAIDMTITGIIGKTMLDASAAAVEVTDNAVLYRIGASYGCHKLISDPPHWSDNGT
ncbi:hypothetical protein G5B88_09180 [Herbaspirillum seropedicae]|uniref:hypothetical protein n=1 Tax=Herbaspirillum seropedicae TaxID=964 RepID=UPI0009D75D51|nr:hypothetical protein [Herbaspirillum seropedicae]MDR6394865.1 D-alanyl-D-alanine dipeptidase [Herbaspirillum seropedicae]UMU21338.1 hypothetical protein G5B88_09180 [Herbaspirillum seropedicae]